MIAAKLTLAPIEFLGVNTPPSVPQRFVRNDGVQHFVIKDIFQKPPRNESLIQQRMNANHAVFFLNRSKNKMVFRSMFSATAPFHFVIAKPSAKVTLIQLIKHLAQIEMFAFVRKV